MFKIKAIHLIIIQAILFAAFLLVTFFFNRFAIDDYILISELNNLSFNGLYNKLYYDWHGRWTSNFFLIYFLKFHKTPCFLALYNILSIVLLYISVFRLLNAINDYYILNLSKKSSLIYALVSVSVLFFCTISSNDTWIWYTSSIVYLWSSIAFFFGVRIFFIKQRNWLDYLIAGISTTYIGGSNEPLTFMIIGLLIYLLLKKKKMILSSLAIALIGLSFSINYLSPGTMHRDEITPSLGVFNLILYSCYGSAKFLLSSIHKTFIPALCLSLPFYLLGKRITHQLTKSFSPIKTLIKNLLLILMVVFLNQLLVVYVLGGLAPDRSSIASSIVIAIILVRYLFLLGNYHQKKYTNLKYVLLLNVVGLAIFTIYYSKIHYNYAKAVDKRIQFIKENDNGLIHVTPLPSSGYIYSAEITTDAAHFKNQHLKSGLGCKNEIVLSPE